MIDRVNRQIVNVLKIDELKSFFFNLRIFVRKIFNSFDTSIRRRKKFERRSIDFERRSNNFERRSNDFDRFSNDFERSNNDN